MPNVNGQRIFHIVKLIGLTVGLTGIFVAIFLMILKFTPAIFTFIQSVLFKNRDTIFLYPNPSFRLYGIVKLSVIGPLIVSLALVYGYIYIKDKKKKRKELIINKRNPLQKLREIVLYSFLLYIFLFAPVSAYLSYAKGAHYYIRERICIFPYFNQKDYLYKDLISCTIDYEVYQTKRGALPHYKCFLQFKNKEKIDIGWENLKHLPYIFSQSGSKISVVITPCRL